MRIGISREREGRNLRRRMRAARRLECSAHQPHAKMVKSDYIYGYQCPVCGNEVSEWARKDYIESAKQP